MSHHQQPRLPPQHHFVNPYQAGDSFTDHFDHYSALVNRYGGRSVPQGKRKSRTPASGVAMQLPANLRSFSPPVRELTSVNQLPESMRSSINFEDNILSSSPRRQSPNTAADAISYTSMSMAGDESASTISRGTWKTSSLVRPSGPTGVQTLKRKPSIQTSTLRAAQPAMSREEASSLSHAQREHLRTEADLAERIKHNPFLYLVNPRFRDWLYRKRLYILVLLVNIAFFSLFYKLYQPFG
jgi:hypothetical protein